MSMPLKPKMAHVTHIFISCADDDKTFLDDLELQFSGMIREGRVMCWHRYKLLPGSDWKESVKQYLYNADIILLLISPAFIASDYCYEEEAMHAMMLHNKGNARVVPIIIRHVECSRLVFGELKSLPIGEPVSMWPNKEDAFSNIV